MNKLERSAITITSLGQAVFKAIEAPGILKERLEKGVALNAMFEFAGYKSWGAFANATESHCLVVANGNQVEVKPSILEGRSFMGVKEKVVTCELAVEPLGKALYVALELVNV